MVAAAAGVTDLWVIMNGASWVMVPETMAALALEKVPWQTSPPQTVDGPTMALGM